MLSGGSASRMNVTTTARAGITFFKNVIRLIKEMQMRGWTLFTFIITGMIGSGIWAFAAASMGTISNLIFYPTIQTDQLHLAPIYQNIPPAGLICILLLYYLVYLLFYLVQNVILSRVSQLTCTKLRWQAYVKLQKMPVSYYDTHSSGDLMSRLTNDVDNISQAFNQAGAQFIQGISTVVFTFIVIMVLSPYLTLIALIILIAFTAIGFAFITRAQPHFIEQQNRLGELNGYIEETFSGHKVIALLNRQTEMNEAFQKYNDAMVPSGTKSQAYSIFIFPWFNFIANTSNLIVISLVLAFKEDKVPSGGLGGGLGGIIDEYNIVAFFVTFNVSWRYLTQPINQWLSIFNLIQAGAAGAERIFTIIDLVPPVDRPDAKTLSNIRGRVEFKDVNFSYNPEATKLNLRNASIVAEPGQVIAIVGPTGAGKTTLINLLTRYYPYRSGSITIDGHEAPTVVETNWRDQISIVLQDTYLFSVSVRENIRYGRLNATDEEIEAATKFVGAHDFIMTLPQGYDTLIEAGGANLSQGQRQLLAIARAMIRKAPILLLDEATSSVDTRTELMIQRALAALMTRCTSFIVAHRLSTIKNADKILVVSDGQIIEQGNHHELLALNGFYANMYHSQFANGGGGEFDPE